MLEVNKGLEEYRDITLMVTNCIPNGSLMEIPTNIVQQDLVSALKEVLAMAEVNRTNLHLLNSTMSGVLSPQP